MSQKLFRFHRSVQGSFLQDHVGLFAQFVVHRRQLLNLQVDVVLAVVVQRGFEPQIETRYHKHRTGQRGQVRLEPLGKVLDLPEVLEHLGVAAGNDGVVETVHLVVAQATAGV